MKELRKVYLVSLLLFSSILITYGQQTYHDSISVQIDDKMELNMTIYDSKGLSEYVERDLKSLQSILKDKSGITENESNSITYVPDKMLSIKHDGAGERIIWENGKQTRNQFNNQCNINSVIYSLQIQFNEFEMLLSDSLISKLKEVIDATIAIDGRFTATYNYSFQGDNLVHNKQLDKINGQMDALSLKGGVGVNLIKSQPVIDLSAEIGYITSKKGIWKNQYYLSYNQLSHFEDNSKINANSFINIGYRHNLSNTFRKPNWLGIELGYLAKRHGDLFEKNTFKFGINWEIGKYMSVSPQLYFSPNFGYPALRIGFGF
jgi:hypothetical protein